MIQISCLSMYEWWYRFLLVNISNWDDRFLFVNVQMMMQISACHSTNDNIIETTDFFLSIFTWWFLLINAQMMIQNTSCQCTNDGTDFCFSIYNWDNRFLLVNVQMMLKISACQSPNVDTDYFLSMNKWWYRYRFCFHFFNDYFFLSTRSLSPAPFLSGYTAMDVAITFSLTTFSCPHTIVYYTRSVQNMTTSFEMVNGDRKLLLRL